VNGLDKDFRGEAFTSVEQLMVKAESVKELHEICAQCGNLANRTQRCGALGYYLQGVHIQWNV
jgi:thymidine kinase